MLLLYAISTEEGTSEVFQELLLMVSEERQKRIKSYTKYEDKIRSLFAEVLLRYVLQLKLSISPDGLAFLYNSYGKPSIRGIDNLHFNLSHSGNWILCGVGNSNIGVDVEEYKSISLDVAERFYSKEENADILLEHPGDQLKMFYKIWTLKESYIKAIGKGLSIPLNSFYFKFQDDDIEFYDRGGLRKDYYFKIFQIDSLHSASVCWQGDSKELYEAEFKKIKLIDLFSLKT